MECTFVVTREDTLRLFYRLVGFELLLVTVYLLDHALGSPVWVLHRIVDLDGERSVGTWFSSVQLLAVGLVLLLKARRPGALSMVGQPFLAAAGSVFVFLSVDEALSIHESITEGMKHLTFLPRFEGGHGIWIPFYLATVAALVFVGRRRVRDLLHTCPVPAAWMLAGSVWFVLGAVGVEVAGYKWGAEATPLMRALEVSLEEFMEMSGVSAMLFGALGLAMEARAVRATTALPSELHPG